MGWNETHRRWQVLRQLEAELVHTDGPLPWSEEHAGLFGDRAAMLAMLRYRWELARDAQVDPSLPEAVLDEQRRRIDQRFGGVRRILERYAHLTTDGGTTGTAHVAA